MNLYNNQILTDHPISYWKFAERSGTVASDSADSNPGTYTNCTLAAFPPQGLDAAVFFNSATPSRTDIPTASNLHPTSQISIGLWFILETSAGGIYTLIEAQYASNASPYVDYTLYINNNVLVAGLGVSTNPTYQLTTPISVGVWYYAVITYDGTTFKLYLNGSLVSSTTFTGPLNNSNQNITIGYKAMWGSPSYYYYGRISSIAIYNYALTPSQITTHHNMGQSDYSTFIMSNNPAAFWRLADFTTTASDPMNGNNGTYSGTYTQRQSSLLGLAPCSQFDGVSGFISVPTAASLAPTTNITIEAWVQLKATPTVNVMILEAPYSSNAAPYSDFNLAINSTLNPLFSITTNGVRTQLISTYAFTVGKWHHILGEYINNANAYLFVDGIPMVVQAVTGNIGASGQPLTIGVSNRGGTIQSYFPGKIASVAIYPTPLASTVVFRNFCEGLRNYDWTILHDSPSAYWPMNDLGAFGAQIVEQSQTISGAFNPANLYGTYTFGQPTAPGADGLSGGIFFDGSTGYASVPYAAILHPTNGITLEAWFYYTSVPTTGLQFIISAPYTSNTSPYRDYCIYLDFSNKWIIFYVNVGGVNAITNLTFPTLYPKVWYHVVTTYDGASGNFYIYLNGMLLGTRSPYAGTISNSGQNTYIAADVFPTLAANYFFSGVLSSIAIYNYALTPQQITNHYYKGISSYDINLLKDGPNSYWPLSDPIASYALDFAGANTGAYTATNFTHSSPYNQHGSVEFPNNQNLSINTSFVNVPTDPTIHPTAALSIECFFYAYTTSPSIQTLLETYNPSGSAIDFNLQLQGNQLYFFIGHGSTYTNIISPSNIIQPYNWYHVVGTFDGTTMTLYINGQSIITGTAYSGAINNGAQPLQIARSNRGSGNWYFQGRICCCAIYNYVLSSAQILAHYNAAITAPSYYSVIMAESSLVALWRLNEDHTNPTAIESKNGLNGPYSNAFQGNIHQGGPLLDLSAQFNGANNSSIDIPTNSLLHPTAAISVEAWVCPTILNNNPRVIVAGNDGSGSPWVDWALYLGYPAAAGPGTNSLYFFITRTADTSPTGIAYNSTIVGQWYHLVGTYDGTTVSFYVNSKLIGSTSLPGAIKNSNQVITIARCNRSGGTGDNFIGLIQNVALYNAALTPTQVQNHFNSTGYAHTTKLTQALIRTLRQKASSSYAARLTRISTRTLLKRPSTNYAVRLTRISTRVLHSTVVPVKGAILTLDGLNRSSLFTGGMS